MSAGRIIIIGGGIAGVATAYQLARRGMGERVLLLEREATIGQHATGQNAGILRTAICCAATRQLARETEEALRDPGDSWATQSLLRKSGVIVSEGCAHESEPEWLDDHRRWGVVEPIQKARMGSLAPMFRPSGARSWWFPRQGVVDVARLLGLLAAGARSGGVRFRMNADVARLHVDAGRVGGVVLGTGEVLGADSTVLAAGAWAPRLATMARLVTPLTVTRRHLLVSAPDARIDARLPVVWDDQAGFYARPESGGLLISACDVEEVSPDSLVPDAAVQESIAKKVSVMLPTMSHLRVAHYWAGLRTLTPDDAPVIGHDPRRPGLFWMAGLGGHGVTISLGASRVAADLLCGVPVRAGLVRALAPVRFE